MKRELLRGLVLGAVCLAWDGGADVAMAQDRDQLPLAGDADGMKLSLADALRIALENNLELKAARVDPTVADERIGIQESAFDGTFGADVQYVDDNQDQTIVDNITGQSTPGFDDSENIQGRLTWTDPLSYGASYTVEFRPTEFSAAGQQVTDFSFQQSLFDSSAQQLTLTYDMPLLRGFGKQVKTEPLVLARTDAEISMDTLRNNAIRVVEQVEGAYWDVVANREALRTAVLALERADDLLELNKKKVEVGTLAPIEITQADAGVASRQEDVIVAEVILRNAEDELRRLLGLPASDPAWSRAVLATDRPSFSKQDIDLEQAIEVALENRSEVINARRELSKRELSAEVARKNTRHQLDLRAQVAPSTSDSDQNTTNQFFAGQPPQSIDSTTESDGTNWQVGLTYSIPLGNRLARADERIAALDLGRSEISLRDTEQTVRVDVRTAVRNVDSGNKRVEAARKNVELQKEKLEAEQKKFENGMSTSFEVLTFQNDLANAELSLIRAALDYAKALTSVERAKGTLLEARSLEIAPATLDDLTD